MSAEAILERAREHLRQEKEDNDHRDVCRLLGLDIDRIAYELVRPEFNLLGD
jgi:hypothetical protein